MSSVTPTQSIANALEFEAARDLVNGELARINPYLKRMKQQGNVDFLVNTSVNDTSAYDGKLNWIPAKLDKELIKNQIAYVQYLIWTKQLCKLDVATSVQINKSIFVAIAAILESLAHLIHIKFKGPVPEEKSFKSLSMQMKFYNAINEAIETDIYWVWITRQAVHLYLQKDEKLTFTEDNTSKAIKIMGDCIEKIENNLFLISNNIRPT